MLPACRLPPVTANCLSARDCYLTGSHGACCQVHICKSGRILSKCPTFTAVTDSQVAILPVSYRFVLLTKRTAVCGRSRAHAAAHQGCSCVLCQLTEASTTMLWIRADTCGYVRIRADTGGWRCRCHRPDVPTQPELMAVL